MFELDNHSTHQPEFFSADEQTSSLALELWDLAYSHLELTSRKVEVVGGVNVNSLNFRIGRYYFKALKARPQIDYVEKFPIISKCLRDQGVPAIEFIENKNGKTVSFAKSKSGDDWHFYAQNFLDAQFFNGSRKEFQTSIEVLKKLPGAVKDLVPTAGQCEPYRSMNNVAILAETKPHLPKNAANDFDAAVLKQWAVLERMAIEFEAMKPKLDFTKLNNYDLHPHNLFFKDGEFAAVLDLESFRAVPAEVATAFSLFKLGRKSISLKEMSIEEFKRIVSSHFDLVQYGNFAKVDLLRRLAAIVRLNYVQSNSLWNQDLFKHINGLQEIDSMFGL